MSPKTPGPESRPPEPLPPESPNDSWRSFVFFNPEAEVTKTRIHLPHWDQQQTTCFITWRTVDSLPKSVWEQWREQRNHWLMDHGIDPAVAGWRTLLDGLPESDRRDFRKFSKAVEDGLDAGHGACPLMEPALAGMVAEALHHFDGDRYQLGDYVIMPNHVHLLVGGLWADGMTRQVESWKKWTALRINKHLGRVGKFWQAESFDHLVRSPESFVKYQKYIRNNPIKAGLRPGQYLHWERPG
ncbi:MAG: hypothetical protein JWL81_2528 [Verrucomicrobiales bacterium]|nr:hypothetical protein [Verrucomicrobiales bacterium]